MLAHGLELLIEAARLPWPCPRSPVYTLESIRAVCDAADHTWLRDGQTGDHTRKDRR